MQKETVMAIKRTLSLVPGFLAIFLITSAVASWQEAAAIEKSERPVLVSPDGFHNILPGSETNQGDAPRISLYTPKGCSETAKEKLEVNVSDLEGGRYLFVKNIGDEPIFIIPRSLVYSEGDSRKIVLQTIKGEQSDLVPPGNTFVYGIRPDAYLVMVDAAFTGNGKECLEGFLELDEELVRRIRKFNHPPVSSEI